MKTPQLKLKSSRFCLEKTKKRYEIKVKKNSNSRSKLTLKAHTMYNAYSKKKSTMWQLSQQTISRQTIGRHFFETDISRLKKKQVLPASNPGPLPSQMYSLPPDQVCRKSKKNETIMN